MMMKYNKSNNTLVLFSFDYKSFNVKITYYADNHYLLPAYDGDKQEQWEDVLATMKFTKLYTDLLGEILKEYPKETLKHIAALYKLFPDMCFRCNKKHEWMFEKLSKKCFAVVICEDYINHLDYYDELLYYGSREFRELLKKYNLGFDWMGADKACIYSN